MTIREILEKKEGRRKKAYRDTENIWHIAIGHKLEGGQTDRELEILGIDDEPDDDNWEGFTITDEQIEELLTHDIEEVTHSLLKSFTQEELDSLDPVRHHAVFGMCYQIGSVSGFPSFVKAVKEGDWDRAAKEMLWRNGEKMEVRSRWYKQTSKRCQAAADDMINGTVEESTPDKLLEDAGFTQDPAQQGEKQIAELLEQILVTLKSIDAKLGKE
ncbi:MAG: glycoside hydrolase family protein [Chloroflexi bacterium]|nr:glycoside hydrolase family protein [Chloroflexota bacterium]